MTKTDKERIAVLEAKLDGHIKSSDENRAEVKQMLTTHEANDATRTQMILDKIAEIEKKFDDKYVQRKEVWAVSSFIGFVVTLISLGKSFISKG